MSVNVAQALEGERPQASDCCAPSTGTALTEEDALKLERILKALANSSRLRLISLIQASPDGEACVCDLTEPLNLTQPTISHHLKLLADVGLLSREKRGVWAYYRIVPESFRIIGRLLEQKAE